MPQRLAGEGLAVVGVDLGVILESQRERIDSQRMRQLVESRLEREAAARLAWRAHERGRADVQPDDAVLRLDRASRVEVPRLQRGRLDERIEARGGRRALLAERSQPPILHPAGFDADLRLGPAADRAEHLRPRQGQLHGEPDLLRRQRADEHVRPRRSFAAERAADEFRQHADVLFGKLERRGQLVTNGEHPLGGVVDGQPVRRGPLRDGRVRLHRIVDLRRNLVLLVDFRVRAAQTVRHVAVRGIRRSFAPSRQDVLWERLVERVFEMDGVGLGRGPHAH